MSKRKRVINGLKSFGKLRIKADHSTILAYSALIIILFVAFSIRILPIRWEIPSGTVLLNEFDPYYQYSITQHMVNNGLFSPYLDNNGQGWINQQLWYPWGLNMSNSLPSLPMTGAVLYDIVHSFGVNIDLMSFLSVLTVFLGTLSVLIMYFIGKDIGGRAVGLFSALFLAMAPGIVQRSSLGFFDTEVAGVIGLLLFVLLFLRANDQQRSLRSSILYSIGAGAALIYFIGAWGAAYYILDLTAVFALIMVLLKRYNQRLLINYSITFGLALLVATKIPYIGLNYLVSTPMLPIVGVFIVLLVAEVLRHNISRKTKLTIAVASVVLIVASAVVLGAFGYLGDIAGKFVSVLDPFARAANALINSVAEHQISAWGNLYIELGITILFFLMGLYFTVKNPTNRNIFFLIFAVTGLYFAASMVRLLVLFAPAYAVIAGVGIISLLKPFFTLIKESQNVSLKVKRKLSRVGKDFSVIAILLIFIILVTNFAFSPQNNGVPRVYSSAYSPTSITSSSYPLKPSEPIPAWLNMLSYTKYNLDSSTVVVAWWDYGDWLTYLGNVTTLVDNTTVNSTQIQNVAYIYMANETQSMQMLSKYNNYNPNSTAYILIFTMIYVSISQTSATVSPATIGTGEEGKWVWMADISGEAQSRFLTNQTFNTSFMSSDYKWSGRQDFGFNDTTGTNWSNQALMNSTFYALISSTWQQYANKYYLSLQSGITSVTPKYFTPAYIAGLDISPSNSTYVIQSSSTGYVSLIPLVALYKIDWATYYADINATSTG